MKIKYGANVIDKEGKILGTVGHLMWNTMTGEVSLFVVNRKAPERDLFFSPADVVESTPETARVGIGLDEKME